MWFANLTNGAHSGPITNSSYSFTLTNGSYTYTVVTSDHTYKPSSYSGLVTVHGSSPSTIGVTFKEVTYSVTFSESGLPEDVGWFLHLKAVNGTENGTIVMLSGVPYTLPLPNGTYTYTISISNIYEPIPSSGTFKVNGSALSVSFEFKEVTYSVTFTESGLPSGIEWYLNLSNGHKFSSTTGAISFLLINGSYTYTISTSDSSYSPVNPYGSFHVNGGSVNIISKFLELFNVTFTETGIPSNTVWFVNLTNGPDSGPITGSSYSFSLTNGSYTYTIETMNKLYGPSPSPGSFTVNGAEASESIVFSLVKYPVTFSQTGIPSGAWYVFIRESNGTNYDAEGIQGTSYTIFLPNGSYAYTEGEKTSDSINYFVGTFTVDGSAVTIPTLNMGPIFSSLIPVSDNLSILFPIHAVYQTNYHSFILCSQDQNGSHIFNASIQSFTHSSSFYIPDEERPY